MPLAKNQMIPLAIDAIASDGSGVGRYEGMVVFVPGAAVGDELLVRVVKVLKTHAFGRLEEVSVAGQGRKENDCPIGDACGGCAFRHLTYEAECAAKQQFVEDALRRIGGLDVAVLPLIATGETERYRNKVQYPVQAGPNGGLEYGFYARRSHRLLSCEDCLLQPEVVNHIVARTAEKLSNVGVPAYDERTGKGLVRHICLRQSDTTGDVLLCIVAAKPALPNTGEWTESLAAEFPQLKGVLLNVNPKGTNVIFGPKTNVIWGRPVIEDNLCGVPVQLDATSFFQVNPKAAALLFGRVREFAAPSPGDTLLDLYCGTGVIGLSMAGDCKRLVGVEIAQTAVQSARQSAAAMGLRNTEFIQGDAFDALVQLAAQGVAPDIILLDPPRKGAGPKTIGSVLQFAPRRLVMVSCNPATLARDLRQLAEGGYHVLQAQPVDMFPRTAHVECVVLLEKRKAI